MGAQRSDFQININTSADTAGAKATADELNKVGASAKDAGEKLSIGLNPDAFNKAGDAAKDTKGKVEDLGEGMKEGAKHAHLFGEAHETAHAALRALGETMPGVGGLAREMFSPATLSIGLLGLGLELLVDHFKKLEEQEQEFLDGAAKGVGSMLRDQAGAAADAAREHAHLADTLAAAASGENSLLTAMNNRIALFENYIAGLKKVEAAEDAAEEARIRRAQREGKITPEQAGAGIDAIHHRAESRDAAHDDQTKQFQVEQENIALHKAQADVDRLAKEKEAADAKARAAEAAAKSAATRAGTGEGSEAEQLKSFQAEVDRKQAEADEAQRRFQVVRQGYTPGTVPGESIPGSMAGVAKDIGGLLSRPFGSGFGSEAAVNKAEEERDQALAIRDQEAKAVAEAKAEAARKAADAQKAQDEADRINKQLQDAQSIIQQYGGPQGKVAIDSAKLTQDRQAAAAVATIQGQSANENAAAIAADAARFDPEAQNLIGRAQNVLGLSRGIQPGSQAAHSETEELKALISELTAELSKLTGMGISNGTTQGLRTEVDALKAEVSQLQGQYMTIR